MTARKEDINDYQLMLEIKEFLESYVLSCILSKKKSYWIEYQIEQNLEKTERNYVLFKDGNLFAIFCIYVEKNIIYLKYDKRIIYINKILKDFTSGITDSIPKEYMGAMWEIERFSTIEELKEKIISLDYFI